MKIESGFIRGLISKLVKTMLRKKVGYNVDILFNEINVTFDDGKAHIRLNVDVDIDKEELMRALKSIGLE